MMTHTFLSYLVYYFLEWEIFQKNIVENIRTHILCSVTFFRKSCCLWDNVEKYFRTEQVTDGNGACSLHAGYKCYKYTHRLCSIHRLSTATMAARTRLNVTLYVSCNRYNATDHNPTRCSEGVSEWQNHKHRIVASSFARSEPVKSILTCGESGR
jgi:hypothetical protein